MSEENVQLIDMDEVEVKRDYLKLADEGDTAVVKLLGKAAAFESEYNGKTSTRYKVMLSYAGEEVPFYCSGSVFDKIKAAKKKHGEYVRITRTDDNFKPYIIMKSSKEEWERENDNVPF